jgi:hypothetical protein
MWSKHSKMKKKSIILLSLIISGMIAFILFFASRLSNLIELDIFDIEDEEF